MNAGTLGAEGAGIAVALEGDLDHFHLAEILQFLELSQVTGRLELEREGERAELEFERGRPVFARTSRGSVPVGEILVHRGVIARDTLERSLEEQCQRPAERLGMLLVKSGRAEREPVARAVQEGLRRILYGLMLWEAGHFRFFPGAERARDDLVPEVEIDAMILEGLRATEELRHRR